MEEPTPPYLQASRDRVIASPWLLGGALIPAVLEDWDYGMNLTLETEVSLDLTGIRADCGLQRRSGLQLAVTWFSNGTGLRGLGWRSDPLTTEARAVLKP